MSKIFFLKKSEIGRTNVPIENSSIKKFWRGDKVDELNSINDIAKATREFVKKKFPKTKWSITVDKFSGGQALNVYLMSAPFNPINNEKPWSDAQGGGKYLSTNQFSFESSDSYSDEAKKVLKAVREFYNQYNYDNSDPMTDYSNIRFYEHLGIGKWDKGFIQLESPKPSKPIPSKPDSQDNTEPKFSVYQKVFYETSKGTYEGIIEYLKYVKERGTYIYGVKSSNDKIYTIWESKLKPVQVPEIPETFTDERLESYYILKDGFPNSQVGSVPLLEDKKGNFYYVSFVSNQSVILRSVSGDNNIEITPSTNEIIFDFKILDYIPNGSKKLKEIIVQWSDNGLKKSFKTWNDFQKYLATLELPEVGYDKIKVFILFENNRAIIDRIDLGKTEGDFNPKNEFIGDYILKQTSAMYWSNFTSMKRKDEAIWQDIDESPEIPLPMDDDSGKPETSENEAVKELDLELETINDLRKLDLFDFPLQNETRSEINDLLNTREVFMESEKFNILNSINDYFQRATEPVNIDITDKNIVLETTKTKDFKDWFGDWQNESYPSSKVAILSPEEGAFVPQIVYHGTWAQAHYSRFKTNKFPIIYFATNRNYAEWFANLGSGIIYECFLNVRFPLDFRPLGLLDVSWSELTEFFKMNYGLDLPKSNVTSKMKVWAWIRMDGQNDMKLINFVRNSGFDGMMHIENNPQQVDAFGNEETTTAIMIFNADQAKLVKYAGSTTGFSDIMFLEKGGTIENDLLTEIKKLRK